MGTIQKQDLVPLLERLDVLLLNRHIQKDWDSMVFNKGSRVESKYGLSLKETRLLDFVSKKISWPFNNSLVLFMMALLIPKLNCSIPTTTCSFWRFNRMPNCTTCYFLMCFQLFQCFTSLPIPDPKSSICCSRQNIPKEKKINKGLHTRKEWWGGKFKEERENPTRIDAYLEPSRSRSEEVEEGNTDTDGNTTRGTVSKNLLLAPHVPSGGGGIR